MANDLKSPCMVCGKAGTMHTCMICGALVCKVHYDTVSCLCSECLKGRKFCVGPETRREEDEHLG